MTQHDVAGLQVSSGMNLGWSLPSLGLDFLGHQRQRGQDWTRHVRRRWDGMLAVWLGPRHVVGTEQTATTEVVTQRGRASPSRVPHPTGLRRDSRTGL